jgi:hypothetical protein
MKVRLTGYWELTDEELRDKTPMLISRDKRERATHTDAVMVRMPAYKFVEQILESMPDLAGAERALMEAFIELGRRAATKGKVLDEN